VITNAELATLASTSAFQAPPAIPGSGYLCGTIDDDKLACCDAEGVFVIDLATGAVLRHIPLAHASEIRRLPDGYVVTIRDPGADGGRLVHLPHDDSPPRVAPFRGYVKSWSAGSGELAIFHQGRLEIRRWPGMEVVHAVDGYHPTLDWSRRLMLVSDGDHNRHVVESMDGDHERRYLEYDNGEPQHFYSLGRGVFEIDHGFTVLGVLEGWRTRLYPELPNGDSISLRLTPDGRGIRTVMANRAHRFDVDFATGTILTALPRAAAGQDPFLQALWHPELDAIVLEDDEGNEALYDLDDDCIVELPPGAQAKQWFDGGRALLLTFPSSDEARPLRIEVWRVR
jgi:hypothetical protein